MKIRGKHYVNWKFVNFKIFYWLKIETSDVKSSNYHEFATCLCPFQSLLDHLSDTRALLDSLDMTSQQLSIRGATGPSAEHLPLKRHLAELEKSVLKQQHRLTEAAAFRNSYHKNKLALESCLKECQDQMTDCRNTSMAAEEKVTRCQVGIIIPLPVLRFCLSYLPASMINFKISWWLILYGSGK